MNARHDFSSAAPLASSTLVDSTQHATRGGLMAQVPCISSGQLMRGATELLIEHHGAMYRLRKTSLGKLILTK